jgi:cell division septum initiation protein DivIVA
MNKVHSMPGTVIPMAEDPVPPSTDAGFEVVRRGYDQGQVDTHLRTLDAQITILVADRNAALEQSTQLARDLQEARVGTEKLRAQVRTLVSPGQTVQGMSERMRAMLRLAQEEVTEMLSRADTEVSRRIKEAEEQVAQITSAARAEAAAIMAEGKAEAERMTHELTQARAELDVERTMAEEQLAAVRREAEQATAAETAKAEQDRARAVAEAETQRALVEEDFTLAMEQRRAEAMAALSAERQAARREVEELREAAAARVREEDARAKERGRAIVADAERRLADLVEVRKRISEQLGDARVVLDRALTSLSGPHDHLAGKGDTANVPSPRDHPTDDGAAFDEARSTDTGDVTAASRPSARRRVWAAAGRR